MKEKLETFLIKCMAHGNPKNFTFSWKKNKHPFGNISQDLSREESTLGNVCQIIHLSVGKFEPIIERLNH